MNVLLKSVILVAPDSTKYHLKQHDIWIKDGIIQEIGAVSSVKDAREIQADNLHVSLGWMDSAVAFGEPGYEERETIAHGLDTAARSGFTDIVLSPNTYPKPDSSPDIISLKNRAQGHLTNLHPLGNLTVLGEGQDLAELYDMMNAGAVGFYDFKKPIDNTNLLKVALQYSTDFDALVHSFPLERSIAGKGVVNEGTVSTRMGLKGIPALAEEIQVARDLFVLEYTGGKLHIPTISSAGSVALIAEAKSKGLDVSCSVALHNLRFDNQVLEDFDTRTKVLPPLRTDSDIDALKKGVRDGVIDMVCSDHIPLDVEHKLMEFDRASFGSISLENVFGVLNGIFDLGTTIDILTRGRNRFNIPEPSWQAGTPANFTLFNPDMEYTFEKAHIHSTSKNSMYLGSTMKGKVYGAINNKQIIFEA